MKTRLSHPRELPALAGVRLGPSGWHEITQERINLFAVATEDHQWIHTDPERARNGPFGAPIAHGYLTLALVPAILDEILEIEQVGSIINYGLNRVRFPAPVPVGSRVRGSVTLLSAGTRDDGMIEAVFEVTFEREGGDRPPCIAHVICLYG